MLCYSKSFIYFLHMAQTFDVPNILPDMFVFDDPSTGAKSVLRKTLMEVPAQHKIDFEPINQKNIRFKITSLGDLLIGRESYIKFDLTVSNQDASKALMFGLGGVHNLFRNIQVRTLSGGVLLQEVDWYNIYQGKVHQFNMDRDYLEMYGKMYGDTTMSTPKKGTGDWICVGMNDKSVTTTEEAGLIKVTLVDKTPWELMKTRFIGLSEVYNTKITYYEVVSIISATVAYLRPLSNVDKATLINDKSTTVWYNYYENGYDVDGFTEMIQPTGNPFRRSVTLAAASSTAAVDKTVSYTFQPFLTLLSHNIPLFVLKDGIELILELDTVNKAFVHNQGSTFTYAISNPKFMATMVTPHLAIQEQIQTMWKSEKGLIWRIPSVRCRKVTTTHSSTSETLQFNVGTRSAMRAFLLMNDSSVEANSMFDITQGLQLATTGYQFKVGGITFPLREVNVTGNGHEAYRQLLMSMDRWGDTRIVHDFSKYSNQTSDQVIGHYTSLTGADKYITGPTRFYIGVDFRRVNGYGDNLSGIDISHAPLDLEITRSSSSSADVVGVTGNPQYYLFVEYDAYLKINSQQVTVLS